jgi:integrase
MEELLREDLLEFSEFGAPICDETTVAGARQGGNVKFRARLSKGYGGRLLRLIAEVLQFHGRQSLEQLKEHTESLLREPLFKGTGTEANFPAPELLAPCDDKRLALEADEIVERFTSANLVDVHRLPWRKLRAIAAASLQLHCGLSSGEVRLLTVGDIDLPAVSNIHSTRTDGRISIVGNERRARREQALPDTAASVVRTWLDVRRCLYGEGDQARNVWVFPDKRRPENPIAHQTQRIEVKRYLRRTGIKFQLGAGRCLQNTFLANQMRIEKMAPEEATAILGRRKKTRAARVLRCLRNAEAQDGAQTRGPVVQ